MALSRKDILKRIRYGRRVQYDLMPAHVEQIEAAIRPTRMFRAVNPSRPKVSSQGMTLGEFHAAQGGAPTPKKTPTGTLTPTQATLVKEMPQKYDVRPHHIRSFIINYIASRDPQGFVKHLSNHFDFPIPENVHIDPNKMGVKAAQEHVKQIQNYVGQLQHHLHRQGSKDYDQDIIKSMGDYTDKTQRSENVLQKMHQHFGNRT